MPVAVLRARVVAVDDDELRLLHDDTFSEAVVRQGANVGWDTATQGAFPTKRSSLRRALVVFFPATVERAEADRIVLLEIIG
jgi:hypothetical protein